MASHAVPLVMLRTCSTASRFTGLLNPLWFPSLFVHLCLSLYKLPQCVGNVLQTSTGRPPLPCRPVRPVPSLRCKSGRHRLQLDPVSQAPRDRQSPIHLLRWELPPYQPSLAYMRWQKCFSLLLPRNSTKTRPKPKSTIHGRWGQMWFYLRTASSPGPSLQGP